MGFASNSEVSAESLFGHVFLVEKDSEKPFPLWNVYEFSVANPSHQSTRFSYVLDGLAGGFKGKFRQFKFYQKLSVYSDVEKRLVWLYDLVLSDEDKIRIQKQLSRAESKEYYFFNQNCATELFKLIDPRVQTGVPWAPIEVLKKLSEKGLLADSQVFEPVESQLVRGYRSLSSSEKQEVVKALASSYEEVSQSLQSGSVSNRSIAFMKRYYVQKPTRSAWHPEWYEKAKVFNSKDIQFSIDSETAHKDPLNSQSLVRLELAAAFKSDRSETFDLGFRPALVSLGDSRFGRDGFKELEVLDFRVRSSESNLSLKNLTLLQYSKIQDYSRLWPQFSWRLAIKYEETELVQERQQLKVDLSFGVSRIDGYAISFLPKISGRKSIADGRSSVGAGAELVLLVNWSKLTLTQQLEYLHWSDKSEAPFSGGLHLDYYWSCHASLFTEANWAVSGSLKDVESRVGVKYYF